ncbi:DUF2827 domain-containing protein [Sphingomonas sp. R1]|uniref:DUF2827 domain-containing protein n=1 Tax=Sphingomonas sp. R1 TaxID=399176 RepID=UPI002225835C|nr:DUF2827 domain-containing protein [Sphingomonas sp. R1]UYY77317.1 DUF2827 domain-containing protein [Sphingomonas sp. R1]
MRAPDESLWTNGIKQNALFLAKLFRNSALAHDVVLLNTTDVPITSALPWDLKSYPTAPFDAACDGLDIVIELGGQISPAQTARIKAQRTRLVSYCCGPEYVQNMEAMIFGRPLWDSIFINQDYDEIWAIPQIAGTTLPFLQTLRRCPGREVPFVWDPMAIESVAGALPHGGEYRPRGAGRRLAVIEPNIDVLKFCLYPILAAERAFRAAPEHIEVLYVANSEHMALTNREFAGLMHHLEIVKAGRAGFLGRVRTPDFLSADVDVVISHQWGLPLNYFYLECCWQGYPLVHNAQLVRDLGYFYPENDIDEAARHILQVCAQHDGEWQAYRDRQRRRIQRFLATSRSLADEYDDILFRLLHRTARAARNC